MKLYAFILICLGAWGLSTNVIAATNNATSSVSSLLPAKIPVVIYDHSFTPSESFDAGITDISYSPDGRYLALYYQRPLDLANIVVWNMQTNKEQTRIENVYPFFGSPGAHFLWAKDSSYFIFQSSEFENAIINGQKPAIVKFYSPINGSVIKRLPIWLNSATFNHDYTKLLSASGRFGYRIYNVADWTYHDYQLDHPIHPEWLVWTADDNILVAGYSPRNVDSFDGISPRWADLVITLVDNNGKRLSRSTLLPAIAQPSAFLGHVHPAYLGDPQVNFKINKVADFDGLIVDMQNLAITKYLPDDVLVNRGSKYVAQGFSPDGQYLYLLMADNLGNESVVLDVNTGKTVSNFEAAGSHLSVSPDGRRLAIAKGKQVRLYQIK